MKKKRAWNFKNRVGERYGRLTVIKENKKIKNRIMWKCLCDCGNTTIVSSSRLANGTRSCGCLQKEKTSKAKFKHGCVGTTEYNAWKNMKKRCYNKNDPRYNTYGERGVIVCERWRDKENGFLNFLEDMGKKPSSELSLERIDNDKNYTPDNCYWATNKTQSRNKTTSRMIKYNGEIHNLEDWGEITGFGKKNIWARLDLGWSIEDALTKLIRNRKNEK
jgi:hypothetical protein